LAKKREEAARLAEEQKRENEARLLVEEAKCEREKQRKEGEVQKLREHYGDAIPVDFESDDTSIAFLEKLRDFSDLEEQVERRLSKLGWNQELAIYFAAVFFKSDDAGALSKACKYWRWADMQEYAISLAERIGDRSMPRRMVSAVWTTRGASHADIDDFFDAERCGLRALELDRGRPHPHNLLARVYGRLGDDDGVTKHLNEAFRLSKHDPTNLRSVVGEMQRVLHEIPEERRREQLLEQFRILVPDLVYKEPKMYESYRRSQRNLNDVPF
jgi:tetratricopeptide (TPR) repeat protein